MAEALQSDYVRTAIAMGHGRRVVWFRYSLRNALLPVVTLIGGVAGHIFAGAVLLEFDLRLAGARPIRAAGDRALGFRRPAGLRHLRLAALRAGVPAGRSPLHVHRSADPRMTVRRCGSPPRPCPPAQAPAALVLGAAHRRRRAGLLCRRRADLLRLDALRSADARHRRRLRRAELGLSARHRPARRRHAVAPDGRRALRSRHRLRRGADRAHRRHDHRRRSPAITAARSTPW